MNETGRAVNLSSDMEELKRMHIFITSLAEEVKSMLTNVSANR